MLFNGVWTTFIAVPYLWVTPAFFEALAPGFLVLAAESCTMVFWFAGFIALAVALPPPDDCHGSVCSALQATTVFGAFTWYDLHFPTIDRDVTDSIDQQGPLRGHLCHGFLWPARRQFATGCATSGSTWCLNRPMFKIGVAR